RGYARGGAHMSGTSGPPQPQSSSAAAVQDILHWSADLASWQRDALRRLCDQEELSEQDFADLVEFCRGPYDTATYGSAKKPEPLTASHTRADSYGQTVALKSIKDVVNVNALADGQILKFRETGLTVVFGGNGSGKSGYSRVLKKACRARASNAPILPNVYAPPSNKPATATIDYSVSGKLAAAKWVDGAPTDDVLSAISVFDSACAIVHVEKTNDVAYT